MRQLTFAGIVLLLALSSLAQSGHVSARQAASRSLTIDQLVAIRHPSQGAWSPDGSRVAFVWDQGGVQNVYVAPTLGKAAAPTALTFYKEGSVDGLFWANIRHSADDIGLRLFFVRNGDLWEAVPGGAPTAVWTTPQHESDITLSPDGTRAAFVRGGDGPTPDWQRIEGDLWIRSLADGTETRLTQGVGAVSSPAWSPDASQIAFVLTKVKLVAEAPAYSGAKILYTRREPSPSVPAIVDLASKKMVTLEPSPGWDPAPAWLDGSHLLVQRVGADNRTRELAVSDSKTGETRVIYREQDPKFWSLAYVASTPVPSPDGTRVAFVSDRDGWDHLYVVPVAGGTPVQLTRGRFEVRNPSWSPDGTRIAFDRNLEGKPGVRHVAVVSVGTGASQPLADITTGRGTNIAPLWSADGKRLLYQHTDPRTSADLFTVAVAPGATALRLTDSMPAGIDRSAFVEPELVSYNAPDGHSVPAYLFVPKGLDRSRKHPAVIWIHGDGINQNYDGWHVERNYAVYYSFHQYLLQKGYVVLAPDYRGSIGYGRDWRQGVHLDVGGKDARDAEAGADYLKTLSFVDADRIGVWGLSYGGFFTLLALTDRPTTFACGIDVAGVPDFAMWHVDPGGAWVDARMGSPEQYPEVYKRAAPIDRMEALARPLLILHGTADVNVPYVESVRLVDRLLKLGKPFDFVMYPGEFHYFHRTHVLRDAWQRVDAFFGEHLKPGS